MLRPQPLPQTQKTCQVNADALTLHAKSTFSWDWRWFLCWWRFARRWRGGDMPHMLFLHFNLNLKDDNIQSLWMCAHVNTVVVCDVSFLKTRRKKERKKKTFFILTDAVSAHFCFCFETWPPHNLLLHGDGVIFGLHHACYCRTILPSFRLRCFPVILSCVHTTPWDHVFTLPHAVCVCLRSR